MINLQKLNRKSASPPPLSRRPAPAPYSPPLGEIIKIYFLPFKKKMGGRVVGGGGVSEQSHHNHPDQHYHLHYHHLHFFITGFGI